MFGGLFFFFFFFFGGGGQGSPQNELSSVGCCSPIFAAFGRYAQAPTHAGARTHSAHTHILTRVWARTYTHPPTQRIFRRHSTRTHRHTRRPAKAENMYVGRTHVHDKLHAHTVVPAKLHVSYASLVRNLNTLCDEPWYLNVTLDPFCEYKECKNTWVGVGVRLRSCIIYCCALNMCDIACMCGYGVRVRVGVWMCVWMCMCERGQRQ